MRENSNGNHNRKRRKESKDRKKDSCAPIVIDDPHMTRDIRRFARKRKLGLSATTTLAVFRGFESIAESEGVGPEKLMPNIFANWP